MASSWLSCSSASCSCRLSSRCSVGRGQGLAVGLQPFAAHVELPALVVDVALVGCQHLNLLLHRVHGTPLVVGLLLGAAQRVLELGQAHALLLDLGGQRLGLLLGPHRLLRQLFEFDRGVFLPLAPLGVLLLELHQALLGALAAIDHKTDLGLELADLGTGLVQLALGLVDLVAGTVVRLPDGLELGLDAAQVGHARLQVVDRLQAFGLDLGLIGLGLAALEEPQLLLPQRHLRLQGVVAAGHFGLLFQLVEIGVELAQDVFHPRQVLACVRQAVLGFTPPLLVLGDPRGLLQKQPQLLGLGFDDAADRALPDDGVGARAQAGAQEHVLHVAPAHHLVVDVVARVALAREHPLDRDFRELVPLAARAVVAVVEHQFDAGPAGRLAGRRAVEDHVLHGLAAQLARLAFAQHPAHGIHDVGLAATIGADHADELPRQQEIGRLGERFEASELDGIETHGEPGRKNRQKRLGRRRGNYGSSPAGRPPCQPGERCGDDNAWHALINEELPPLNRLVA